MSFIDLHTNVSLGHTKIAGLGGEKLWLCPTLGGDKLDISGNGNHGTYNGGMGTVADVSNGGSRAYDNNSNNQYVEVAGTIGVTFVSIALWVKRTALENTTTWFCGTNVYSSISWSDAIYTYSGVDYVRAGNSQTAVSPPLPSSGDWYHLCTVSSGGTTDIYVDGVLHDSVTTASPSATTKEFRLGSSQSATVTSSKYYDDIRVFDRALTTSEIKHLASKRGVLGTPRNPVIKKRRIFYAPTAPVTTTAKAVVLKKPKPCYATGYARNASESANPNLWKGLVGAWMPSFGVTGNTLKDVSGNGNDGTLTNMDAASDWVGTSKGLALDFDGVNDYVSINAANLYPDLTQATWSFWIKFRSFTYFYNQISETVPAPSTTNYQLSCLVRPTGKLAFYAAGNPDSNYDNTGIHTLSTDTWYNLTYVFKGSERQEGWVNGIYDGGAGSPIASLTASTQDCRFSFSNFATRYINGTYGSVRLYSRALSPTEIKQLYLNPAAPFERKQQTVGISTAQAFNPYWANQATQLAGTLQ